MKKKKCRGRDYHHDFLVVWTLQNAKKKCEHEIGDGWQKYFATCMSKTVFFVYELPQIFKITFLVNKILKK